METQSLLHATILALDEDYDFYAETMEGECTSGQETISIPENGIAGGIGRNECSQVVRKGDETSACKFIHSLDVCCR